MGEGRDGCKLHIHWVLIFINPTTWDRVCGKYRVRKGSPKIITQLKMVPHNVRISSFCLD